MPAPLIPDAEFSGRFVVAPSTDGSAAKVGSPADSEGLTAGGGGVESSASAAAARRGLTPGAATQAGADHSPGAATGNGRPAGIVIVGGTPERSGSVIARNASLF